LRTTIIKIKRGEESGKKKESKESKESKKEKEIVRKH
jgi:hypothetical protein